MIFLLPGNLSGFIFRRHAWVTSTYSRGSNGWIIVNLIWFEVCVEGGLVVKTGLPEISARGNRRNRKSFPTAGFCAGEFLAPDNRVPFRFLQNYITLWCNLLWRRRETSLAASHFRSFQVAIRPRGESRPGYPFIIRFRFIRGRRKYKKKQLRSGIRRGWRVAPRGAILPNKPISSHSQQEKFPAPGDSGARAPASAGPFAMQFHPGFPSSSFFFWNRSPPQNFEMFAARTAPHDGTPRSVSTLRRPKELIPFLCPGTRKYFDRINAIRLTAIKSSVELIIFLLPHRLEDVSSKPRDETSLSAIRKAATLNGIRLPVALFPIHQSIAHDRSSLPRYETSECVSVKYRLPVAFAAAPRTTPVSGFGYWRIRGGSPRTGSICRPLLAI